MVYKSGQTSVPFCHNPRVWQTDGQTDGRTEFSSLYRVCITCSAVKTGGSLKHFKIVRFVSTLIGYAACSFLKKLYAGIAYSFPYHFLRHFFIQSTRIILTVCCCCLVIFTIDKERPGQGRLNGREWDARNTKKQRNEWAQEGEEKEEWRGQEEGR